MEYQLVLLYLFFMLLFNINRFYDYFFIIYLFIGSIHGSSKISRKSF